MSQLTVIVLAAGKGTRMRSALPKVLHPVLGRPLVGWVLETALELDPARIVLVTSAGGERIEEAARRVVGERCPLATAVQDPPRGTGHAVQVALEAVPEAREGVVLVLYGDMPLVRAEGLPLQGLMCIPPVEDAPSGHFAFLKRMADDLGLAWVSMGMSGDYPAAVELGATHIRVGSAIFGAR